MADLDKQRELKYNLLKEQILDQGYDALAFQVFCEQLKKGGGDDIDAWTFQELQQTIQNFKNKEDAQQKRFSSVKSEQPMQQQQQPKSQFLEEQKQDTPTPNYQQVPKSIDDVNFSYEIECKLPQRTLLTDYMLENSHKQVEIVMNEFMTKSEGLFSTGYGAFKVETKPIGWAVWRRFSDFHWLRQVLQKTFPCNMLPPIPKKKLKVNATEQTYLQKRMKVMELFIANCLHHPLIRTHPAFSDFLSITDDVKFKDVQQTYEKAPGPNKPADFITVNGTCTLEISPQLKSYSQTLQDYLKNSGEIYTKLGNNFKKLFLDLDTLSGTLLNIQDNFMNLNKVTDLFCKTNQQYTQGGLQQIQTVYNELSKFMEGWYQGVIFQMKNVKENFYEFFRYHRKMQEQAFDFVNQRNSLSLKFNDMKSKLNDKKEKLFLQQDTSKWELPADLPRTVKELQVNKLEAFKYMLFNETRLYKKEYIIFRQVNECRDTYAFINRQVVDEIHEMMDFRMIAYCKKFIRVAQMRALETAKLHHVLADFMQSMMELQGNSSGGLMKRTASIFVDNKYDQFFGVKTQK